MVGRVPRHPPRQTPWRDSHNESEATAPMRTLQPKLVAVLALVAAALFLAPMASANADDTGSTSSSKPHQQLTFGIGPALPVPSTQVVDGRPYLSFLGSPGGTVQDAVALLNLGHRPVTLSVYAADATDTSAGDFALLSQSAPRTDAAKWIHLQLPRSGKVTVPPRHGNHYGRVVVPFTASIPADASPGDHAAGIIASLSSIGKDQQGARIRFNQRIGVRTYFQLSGAAKPQLTVKNLQVHYQRTRNLKGQGDVSLSYDVKNTGNLRLSVSPLVSLDRWLFSTLNFYPPSIPDLLPGATVELHQTLKDVGGFGKMNLTVNAFGTPVDTTVPQKAPPASASVSLWAWPWLVILTALLIVLLLIGAGTWWWRRHRRKARLVAADQAGPSSRPKAPAMARLATVPRRKATS